MDFIATDTETGGFYPSNNALLSIGACCSWSGETFQVYITTLSQPGKFVVTQAAEINGYSEEEWKRRGAVPLTKAMVLYVDWITARKAERRKAKMVCHNLEFDRSHLRDAERFVGIEIPHRHDWRCSQILFGSLMDKGAIAVGSSGLDRLGELSGFWPVAQRPEIHNSLYDAQACLHGYLWLLDVEKREEQTLRQLYTDSLAQRRRLEAGMQRIYDVTEGGADGAPDASSHGHLCNEISGFAYDFVTDRKDALSLIFAERIRQIQDKGWTPEHDDEHGSGALARAAMCYAMPPALRHAIGEISELWPFEEGEWKPSPDNRVRELTIAGAFAAAEIDRLLRLKGKEGQG